MERIISQCRLELVVCSRVFPPTPGRDTPQLEELSQMCVLSCLSLVIAVSFAVVFSPELFAYIF